MAPQAKNGSSLNIELFGSSAFFTLNRAAMKLFDFISFWIVVKLLSADYIGLIGTAIGFISVLGIFYLSPFRRIYKNFPEVERRFSDHLSAYIMFWGIEAVTLVAISALVAAAYYFLGQGAAIGIVLVGMVAGQMLSNLQMMMQEIFFAKLKQKVATYFNLASSALFLISMGLLVLNPRIEVYLGLIIAKAAFTAAGFFVLAWRELGFRFTVPKDWKKLIRDALSEFIFADHVTAQVLEITWKGYLFIMSFFVARAVVGDFSIALWANNLLTFLPLIIYNISTLAISKVTTKDGLNTAISVFTKYAAVVSLLQFGAFLLLAGTALSFFTEGNTERIFHLAALLGIGTTISNIATPIHAASLLKGNANKYLTRVMIPAGALIVAGYVIASAFFAPETVIFVYVAGMLLYAALGYMFLRGQTGARLSFELVTDSEREVLSHLLGKISGWKGEPKKQYK